MILGRQSSVFFHFEAEIIQFKQDDTVIKKFDQEQVKVMHDGMRGST